MTTKTEQFKSTQIPLWEDGDLANGANFAQLITAIATLVNDTKDETLTEASQAAGSGYTDTEAKAVVKAFLNAASDYQGTDLYTKIKALIDEKAPTSAVDGKLNKDEFRPSLINELEASKLTTPVWYSYTSGNMVELKTSRGASPFELVAGSNYLKAGQDLKAQYLNGDGSLLELTRPDGARLIVDTKTRTAKPAANLIG